MSEESLRVIDGYVSEYESRGEGELVQEFKRLLEVTVETICRMASVLRVLVEKNFDVSQLGLPLHMEKALLKVAYNQLIPEAYERFMGVPYLLTAVANLPVSEQAWISKEGATVPVLLVDGGPVDILNVPVVKLSDTQRKQVFSRDGLRDLTDQRVYIESKKSKKANTSKTAFDDDIIVDRKRCGLEIEKKFFGYGRLMSALSLLR